MTYATDEEVALAEELGYTWDHNQQRGHRFQKGQRRVWAATRFSDPDKTNPTPHYKLCWQTADLVDGHRFCNHQKFSNLSDALRRP